MMDRDKGLQDASPAENIFGDGTNTLRNPPVTSETLKPPPVQKRKRKRGSDKKLVNIRQKFKRKLKELDDLRKENMSMKDDLRSKGEETKRLKEDLRQRLSILRTQSNLLYRLSEWLGLQCQLCGDWSHTAPTCPRLNVQPDPPVVYATHLSFFSNAWIPDTGPTDYIEDYGAQDTPHDDGN